MLNNCGCVSPLVGLNATPIPYISLSPLLTWWCKCCHFERQQLNPHIEFLLFFYAPRFESCGLPTAKNEGGNSPLATHLPSLVPSHSTQGEYYVRPQTPSVSRCMTLKDTCEHPSAPHNIAIDHTQVLGLSLDVVHGLS